MSLVSMSTFPRLPKWGPEAPLEATTNVQCNRQSHVEILPPKVVRIRIPELSQIYQRQRRQQASLELSLVTWAGWKKTHDW